MKSKYLNYFFMIITAFFLIVMCSSVKGYGVTVYPENNDYHTLILPNSLSGEEVAVGSPDLRETTDWWGHINHLMMRRIIENWINDLSNNYSLGYRKGDQIIIDLSNLTQENQSMVGAALKLESPTMAAALINPDPSITSEEWFRIDSYDTIYNEEKDYWISHKWQSAYNTSSDTGSYFTVTMTPADYILENNDISLTITTKNIVITRLKTTLENPDEYLNAELGIVNYVNQVNAMDSSIDSNDSEKHYMNWQKRPGEEVTGNFYPKLTIAQTQIAPLKVSQTNVPNVNLNTALSESNLNFNDYLSITGTHKASEVVVSPLDPNQTFTQSGEQFIPVIIEEKLDDQLRSIRYENFKLNVLDLRKLTAEVVPFKTELDIGVDYYQAKDFIKNVQLDGKELPETEYDVSFVDINNAERVGQFTFKVKVTSLSNQKEIILDVPMTVNFNNTLVIKGAGHQTVMGISLHDQENDQLKLEASRVTSEDQVSAQINDYFIDEYFKIEGYFPIASSQNLTQLSPKFSFSKMGGENVEEAYQEFETQTVSSGDIVKVWHQEFLVDHQLINHYENGKQHEICKHTHEDSYFEMSETGFYPIMVNQLTPKTVNFLLHDSQKVITNDFKNNLEKYFESANLEKITPVNIVTFPNTKMVGDQTMIVRVEETLSSGKTVQYDYEIPVYIRDEWVNVTMPTKMLFSSNPKNKKEITSEEYQLKNNSVNTDLSVELSSFNVSNQSEVVFLNGDDTNPTDEQEAIRLNLAVNDELRLLSLNSRTKPTKLTDLRPETATKLTFDGEYFNFTNKHSSKAQAQMVLKFMIKE